MILFPRRRHRAAAFVAFYSDNHFCLKSNRQVAYLFCSLDQSVAGIALRIFGHVVTRLPCQVAGKANEHFCYLKLFVFIT